MSRRLEIKSHSFFEIAIYGVFLFVAGLVLPVFLIPLIKFTGYSEVVEEIAKALAVFFLILNLPRPKLQILAGVGFGFLFGLSENFFYLNQIFQLGDFSVFWQRFFWTLPMHIITTLVIVLSGLAGKKFLIFGVISAVILHSLFNALAVDFLMR